MVIKYLKKSKYISYGGLLIQSLLLARSLNLLIKKAFNFPVVYQTASESKNMCESNKQIITSFLLLSTLCRSYITVLLGTAEAPISGSTLSRK